jgi:hypothetical protein
LGREIEFPGTNHVSERSVIRVSGSRKYIITEGIMVIHMGTKQIKVWVTIVISMMLVTGCGISERRTLAKCSQLESIWGIQTDKRMELLSELGISRGKEAMVLYRMKQHGTVNHENYSVACLHIINDHTHSDIAAATVSH